MTRIKDNSWKQLSAFDSQQWCQSNVQEDEDRLSGPQREAVSGIEERWMTPFNTSKFYFHRRMWVEQRRIHVNQSQLLCRDGCGYYGNPAWQGYCSKCWRERKAKQPASRPRTNAEVENIVSLSGVKRENKAKIVRGLFSSTKMAPKQGNGTAHAVDPKSGDADPPKASSPKLPADFTEFLKFLRKPSAQNFHQHCMTFLKMLETRRDITIQKQAEMVQDFYQSTASHFQNYSDKQRHQMMEHIEKLLMTQLYKFVFCPDCSDDEQKDLFLQKKIRSLQWVTPCMLGVPGLEKKSETGDHILSAMTAIIEMDARRAPQDKLSCICKCCQHVFAALAEANSEPANADDFLSSLILVVLKANPPRLHSNVQYVVRFGLPHNLMAGESAYNFTNLCCAVTFIEKLDGPSLNLSEDQFQDYMQAGRSASLQESVTTNHLSSVQKAWRNIEQLAELQGRQERLTLGVQNMQKELDEWVQSVKEQVETVMSGS
ncbi:rab5 GDP/GTP exchange factor-like isoform X2 [Polypterus senegalus]|uniref:rab5 GDP/GTP exchange factor-like isoform X2 n=1 Tax=Polypterus senegalus TaxID=55291 RepID=UPI001963298E|nr:rab5 GDP/GTP exchange factor-like isoform X2 [Polypterus senegalus]